MRSAIALSGQTVAITGAGQGLGRAYAVAVAAAGADVLINDVDLDAADETAEIIRDIGAQAVVVGGPVEDPDVGRELVSVAQRQLGGLHAMILNAGVMSVAPAAESKVADMRRLVEVNLLGTMFCGVLALRSMGAQGHGSLVLVTSGARFGMNGLSTYGATKAAVASLVWSWASEFREHGVRVNGLSPLADTAMFALNPTTSTGPTPASIAPAAVYLVSDENVLSGEILRFDGESLSIYLRSGSEMTAPVARSQWSPDDITAAVGRLVPATSHPQ